VPGRPNPSSPPCPSPFPPSYTVSHSLIWRAALLSLPSPLPSLPSPFPSLPFIMMPCSAVAFRQRVSPGAVLLWCHPSTSSPLGSASWRSTSGCVQRLLGTWPVIRKSGGRNDPSPVKQSSEQPSALLSNLPARPRSSPGAPRRPRRVLFYCVIINKTVQIPKVGLNVE